MKICWYKKPLKLVAPFNHAIRVKAWVAISEKWGLAIVRWDKKWVEELKKLN